MVTVNGEGMNVTRTQQQIEHDRHERRLWTEQHARRLPEVQDKVANTLARENTGVFSQGMNVLEVGPGDIPVDSHLFYHKSGTHNYMVEIASPAVVKINKKGRQLASEHGRHFHAVRASMREFDVWGKFLTHYLHHNKRLDGFYARSSLHVEDKTLIHFFQALGPWIRSGTKFLIEGKTTNDPKIQRSKEVSPGLYADPEENNHLRHGWSHDNVEQLAMAMRWEIDTIGIRQEPVPGSANLVSEFLYFIASQK